MNFEMGDIVKFTEDFKTQLSLKSRVRNMTFRVVKDTSFKDIKRVDLVSVQDQTYNLNRVSSHIFELVAPRTIVDYEEML